MKPAKLTLIKILAIFFQYVEFCKTQSGVDFGNISYLNLDISPRFGCQTVFMEEYPKIQKSQLIRNNLYV